MTARPIPYGRQSISEADIEAVVGVLRSDWLTQGPSVERFERAVAEYCGACYAVAVNSATSALHLAALAAGLGPGDRLWTSPNTFVASANCGRYCGADVDFVDIDPHSYNLGVAALEEKLVRARRLGRLPKLVVPVHFAGQSCEMAPLFDLSREYGFTIVEDASHAVGGSYRGEPVGRCSFSAMTVFSFHPVKIITSAEGGLVTTNSRELYERLLRLRSHGITRDPALMRGDSPGPWYYQQVELGFNYRMTDLQAALGVSQLSRLDAFVARRRELAARYDAAFAGWPLTVPWQHPDCASAYHLYPVALKLDQIERSRREVFESMREAGIGVNLHYIPVHTQPYYQDLGFREGMFPESERYYAGALSLPLYFGLSHEDQDRVIDALREALS